MHYEKIVVGKRVRYVPIAAPEVVNSEFTPEQIVTMVGTMGIMLTESIGRLLPEHTKVAREVARAEKALLELFRNTGQAVDRDTAAYCCEAWNETMERISKGIPVYTR